MQVITARAHFLCIIALFITLHDGIVGAPDAYGMSNTKADDDYKVAYNYDSWIKDGVESSENNNYALYMTPPSSSSSYNGNNGNAYSPAATNTGGYAAGASPLYPDVPSTTEVVPIRPTPPPTSTTINGSSNAIVVGLLFQLSGLLAAESNPCRDALLLAIDEINRAGGILGRPLVAVVVDLGVNPAQYRNATQAILAALPAVVFGVLRASVRTVVVPVLQPANVLLFTPGYVEGFELNCDIFYISSVENQNILPAVDFAVKRLNKRRWFFVGYFGPNVALPQIWNAIVTAQLASEYGIAPVGEIYVPANQTDYSAVIQAIRDAQADVIFPTLLGDQNIPFHQQLAQSGLLDEFDSANNRSRYEPYNARNSACGGRRVVVITARLDEALIARIGADNVTGVYTTSAYYQTTDTPANAVFLTNFQRQFPQYQRVGDFTQSAYSAVYLWKEMVERAQSFATDAVRAAGEAGGIAFDAPEGHIEIDGASHFTYKHNRIGCVAADGLIDGIIGTVNAIKPDPYLRNAPFTPAIKASLTNQIAVIRQNLMVPTNG